MFGTIPNAGILMGERTMMRQKKRKKKSQKSRFCEQKWFRIGWTVLCLLVFLTGCEQADKALVFSADGWAETVAETAETEGVSYESGQQAGKGDADGTADLGQSKDESGMSGNDSGEGSASSEENASVIYVHVCGAVTHPGVVEVPSGSRAWDALEAAGGFSPEADKEYVNLASPVEDGQQLYFPTTEEAERWRAGMTVSRSGQITAESDAGLININTADEKLLCTLPGIGEARAQAIIAYRQQKGPFERPEDIMKVAGIKQSAYDKISTQITVE